MDKNKSIVITFRVEVDTLNKLRKEADGESLAVALRKIINNYFREKENEKNVK